MCYGICSKCGGEFYPTPEIPKDGPCVHGRPSWQSCPHCLGVNNVEPKKEKCLRCTRSPSQTCSCCAHHTDPDCKKHNSPSEPEEVLDWEKEFTTENLSGYSAGYWKRRIRFLLEQQDQKSREEQRKEDVEIILTQRTEHCQHADCRVCMNLWEVHKKLLIPSTKPND
jgi:hypothetical protein